MKRTVITIEPHRVLLGDENGQFKEYPIAAFNFKPAIGDTVEVFHSADGSEIVVIKVQSAAPMPVAQMPARSSSSPPPPPYFSPLIHRMHRTLSM